MRKSLFSPKGLAFSAAIAAVYVVLTVFATIYFGPVQFRISEAFTLLPVFFPEAIPGLFIGCLVGNLLMGAVPLDIILGSLASLIAASLTYAWRKNRYIAAMPPVVVNALIVGGVVLPIAYGAPFWASIAYVALGQAASCYLLGLPLLKALEKTGLSKLK